MGDLDDMELVGRFAAGESDDAFAELVRRHINLVYSVAMRRLANPGDAEEVTQAVFIILARKAASLKRGTILPGWLYQTAQLTAANFQRSAIRRQRREQEALMQFVQDSEPDVSWQRLQPLLEEAMSRLGDKERDAIVLRFFENQTVGEVAAALEVNEAAAQKRVNRATEKLRNFFARRGVPISAGVLVAAIGANSVQAAPAGLSATVTAAAVLKGAAASFSTLTLIQGTLKVMAWTKIKTTVVIGAIALLAAGTGIVAAKYVKAERAAKYPNLQGAWQGTLDINGAKLRLVLHFAKDKGAYQVTMDSVDQNAQNLAVTSFSYDYPSVQIKMAALGIDFEGKVNSDTNEIAGTFKQLGRSSPMKFDLTNAPAALTQLDASDYTPRKGSDLQGLWKGSLKVGATTLRLNLKISEQIDGTFIGQMDSVDQGASGLTISSVSYQRPVLTFEMVSIGGSYVGSVSSDDTKISGTWKQGAKSYPLVLARADALADQATEADYTYGSPLELPGHWHGTMDVKQVRLRLAFDIGHMPDGSYICDLISLDQGAAKIPATAVEFSAPKVRIDWKGIGAVYSGELKDGKLSGKWTQGKIGFPLKLERAK